MLKLSVDEINEIYGLYIVYLGKMIIENIVRIINFLKEFINIC